jgi:hypothetical protein
MRTTKINIGIALSRNFDKVSLEMVDEPVQFETEDEFREEIRKRFMLLREEINREYTIIQR